MITTDVATYLIPAADLTPFDRVVIGGELWDVTDTRVGPDGRVTLEVTCNFRTETIALPSHAMINAAA
jgi:hypothetical protein